MSEALYGSQSDSLADRYGVPRPIARRLFARESAWNPTALGANGEVGLGQLKVAAAQDGGINAGDRGNPLQNMRASLIYLKQQYDATGSWLEAAARYNQGPSGAYGPDGELTTTALLYGRDVGEGITTKRGTHPAGTTPMGMSKPAPGDVEKDEDDCSASFAWTDPTRWVAGLKCAFKGGVLVVATVALVVYAGYASLKA